MSNYKAVINGFFLSVVFILLYHFQIASLAVVDLQVETDSRTLFKIYYKQSGGNWSEKNVSKILIKPGKTHYAFRLTDISKVAQLRIDTSEKPATVTVKSVQIHQSGYEPLRIESKEHFEKLRPENGIAEFTYSDTGFTVKPATRDPQVIFDLPQLATESRLPGAPVRIAAIIVVSFLLAFWLPTVFVEYRLITSLALVVLTLIAVMAGISLYNLHPDEAVHVQAAEYYQHHNLPPQVGDPEILHTYSIYGVSRLHSGEIAYLVAGKFAWLLQPFHLPSYLSLRLFNVTLFAVIFFLTVKNSTYRILLIPLLLSPQIWYLFSYFNSEAFALFIVFLMSYQMVEQQSALNRLLDGKGSPFAIFAIFGLGILLGLLLLSKMNFYFYGVFLFFYFVWRLLFKKTTLTKNNVFCILSVMIIGCSIYGGMRITDSYVNDFSKSEKYIEVREKYAEKMYKPSTPLDKKYAYLQMKDRGVSLRKIIDQNRWGEKSFRSSFGEYGHMTVAASYGYYDCVRYIVLLLVLAVCAAIIKNGGWEGGSLLAITLLCSFTLMAMALNKAWTVDFQPQGRYFLPIIGMLSVLSFQMRRHLANLPCLLLFCAMYSLSLYSFIFVALAGISRL